MASTLQFGYKSGYNGMHNEGRTTGRNTLQLSYQRRHESAGANQAYFWCDNHKYLTVCFCVMQITV